MQGDSIQEQKLEVLCEARKVKELIFTAVGRRQFPQVPRLIVPVVDGADD